MGLLNWITEPLAYGFFQRGLIAGLLVALSCGLLSTFVVWRGMSFIGDALSHAVLPGIVIALLCGIPMQLGAFAFALLTVLLISALSHSAGFKEDTAIGVIFSGTFALGVLLLSKINTSRDLTHILFGSILGISEADLIFISAVSILVLVSVTLFYKELVLTSFDPAHAKAIGLSPALIQSGLLFLLALTTVSAIQTVGVVLILSLLITPGATASLLSKRLSFIIALSLGIASFAVWVGFYLSYYLDLPSGASIVLILAIFFSLAFIKQRIGIIIKSKA